MELSTRCGNCGKQVFYGEQNAGAVWLCPACGSRVQLPAEIPIAPPPPPLPVLQPDPTFIQPTQPEPEAQILEEVPESKPAGNPLVPWLIGAGALIFVLGMTLLWTQLRTRGPTWEQLHRDEVLDIKSEAERLARRGQIKEAYERFQDLMALVSGNPIDDPDLKQALQTAEQEENDLLTQLLRPPTESTTSTQPVVATQPSVLVAQATQPATQPMARRPLVQRLTPPPPLVDDERIGRAITNGVNSLLQQFEGDHVRNGTGYDSDAVDALAIYALLQAYQATGDSRLDPRRPFMSDALRALKEMPLNGNDGTYGRSLRMNALALSGRAEDRGVMEEDLAWLLQAQRKGAFTYPPRVSLRFGDGIDLVWDNSNSQYGLLGVWAAAEEGLNVPRGFWELARDHWADYQFPNGQWGYAPEDKDPSRNMTLAGLASLLVTEDYLYDDSSMDTVEREPFSPPLRAGMAWLENGDNSVVHFQDSWINGYALYGLERVGLASGFKYFGSHDWYRERAAELVSSAQPDGGWGGPVVETSFALLFLARGRHPVVMNKLRFDGYWDNRPRDVANLARYASKTLEHQLNWQVVPINRDWQDWTDGPILYIASDMPPKLEAADLEKIRQFVLNGGLLLTEADGGSASFTQWASDLGTKLFAPYSWATLPQDHPLWTVGPRTSKPMNLSAISNGARVLMIHLPDDVSRYWQTRAQTDHPDEFTMGMNIFLYASGRTELRNRIATTAIDESPGAPAATITMTQIQLTADSDPEPAAWPRFARWFRQQTNLGVNLLNDRMENLSVEASPIAHLTGVAAFTATDGQVDALKKYVDAGGVVLIDPCGGPNDFLKSVREDLLTRAFPSAELDRVAEDHPLLTNSGDGMSQLVPLALRDYVRGLNPPIERGIWMLRSGKGAVVVSSLDITSGLLGTNTWGIAGFTPDYSLALAKNFVLWAWDGAKEGN